MAKIEKITVVSSSLPKLRDPSSRLMQALRKSGAAGTHENKKDKSGRKAKHKKAGVVQW